MEILSLNRLHQISISVLILLSKHVQCQGLFRFVVYIVSTGRVDHETRLHGCLTFPLARPPLTMDTDASVQLYARAVAEARITNSLNRESGDSR